MSDAQRIIKYFAIALAILLVFNIFGSVLYVFTSIGNIFKEDNSLENLEILEISGNFEILDIEVSSVNIIIKNNDYFKIETNNKNINTKQEDNKLFITEKKYSLFNHNNTDLIIYIPKDYTFEKVTIESGAGKVNINNLDTKKMHLDLGAGKVDINDLFVFEKIEVDGGAGEINITNSNINNLDLDMGIGNLNLSAKITGDSEIDTGIGQVDIDLVGILDDYKIKVDKGIGNTTIAGNSVSNDIYYGNGNNLIDINGGIGSINLDFIN